MNIANGTKLSLSWAKMFPDFLVGYDLVGQEDKGHSLLYFIDELMNQTTAEKLSIPYFFHAGETSKCYCFDRNSFFKKI